jgi:[ribosomal protein S5]-alanine N-acetyltransferase
MHHLPNTEIILEADRLRLEPVREGHALELFEVLANEQLYLFIPREPPQTIEALTNRFKRLEKRSSPNGDEMWLNWIIRSKTSACCMGRIEITIRSDRSAYLAYELGVPYWGQGFATEACRKVLKTLKEEYGVSQVVAEVDTRNAASIRLLERLGFQRISVHEKADFFKGSNSDEYKYALG